MVERICPRCEAGNPSEQAYCGHCGLLLQPGASGAAPASGAAHRLARRVGAPLAQRSVRLPVQWKQASKVVALGVASIAAEVGLAWLQQRQQAQSQALARPQSEAARVLAVGRRIRTTWRNGQLYERVDEQVLWMAPDETRR